MYSKAEMITLASQGWNVVAILSRETKSGRIQICYRVPGRNLVTNAGDLYYAQASAGETTTVDFDHASTAGLRLGTGVVAAGKTDTDVTTFIASAKVALTSGYEKTNDTNVLNTGAATDTVTWMYQYTAASFNNGAVAEGAIVDNITTPTAALTHFLFAAAFSKGATEALTVFVNHNFLGV